MCVYHGKPSRCAGTGTDGSGHHVLCSGRVVECYSARLATLESRGQVQWPRRGSSDTQVVVGRQQVVYTKREGVTAGQYEARAECFRGECDLSTGWGSYFPTASGNGWLTRVTVLQGGVLERGSGLDGA
jgi:hypothetical protein